MKSTAHSKSKISISAVVPVYNTETWLRECLDSLVNQSIPFYNIIAVDDESEDSSKNILKEYAEKYSNIEVVSIVHSGLGAVRNEGIRRLTSDYVLFVDSDDMLNENTVETLSLYLSETNADYFCFCGEVFGAEDTRGVIPEYKRNIGLKEGDVVTGEDLFKLLYPSSYYESACMAVYRTNYLRTERFTFPEGLLYEDNYFTFFALTMAKTAGWTRQRLYMRRVREGSIVSSEYTKKNWLDFTRVILELFKEARDRGCYSGQLYRAFFRNMMLSIVSKYEDKVNGKYELDDDDIKLVTEVRNMYLDSYRAILSNIPFNKDIIIGVYGVGKHTKGLLQVYRELFGEIKADLMFITTKGNETFEGKPVFSVDDINLKSLDAILISSFYYEADMEKEIRKRDKDISIIKLYEEDGSDMFSGLNKLELV